MRANVREERGGVLALSALTIPIFIVLVAMAVDVGTWYTHKRQLQNRADAAALAAGVAYSSVWSACNGDAATKALAEGTVDSAARLYAGDPQVTGPLHNTEVTEQTRVNVEVNAPPLLAGAVDPDTSWNDVGIVGTSDSLGPCDPHPADDISPNEDSYWVQVGVRERDQRSLFGFFGVDLLRNRAHARVELQPAAAGKGFLPVAIPENQIEQVQIRYLNYCNPASPVEMARATLQPLAAGYQNGGPTNTVVWGPTIGNAPQGDPTGVPITIPSATDCGGGAGPYIPIVSEVRVAGVPSTVIDIDTATCQQLISARLADCWTGLSNIRVFKDNPSTEPWFQEVEINGGTCGPDGYFAVTTLTGTCTYSGSVVIDFNDVGGASVAADDADVTINGAAATWSGGPGFTFPDGLWTMNGAVTNNTSGRSNVTVGWCVHPDAGNQPCKTNGSGQDPHGSSVVHAVYRNNEIAPLLTMVRTSGNIQMTGTPLSSIDPLDWFRANPSATPTTLYPTVGLEATLYVGQRRVLRASGPQSNQSLDCEPATGGQGHDFQMFATGCDPWYTHNRFAGAPWWFPSPPGPPPAPGSCPDKNGILAIPNAERPSSTGQPWQCVVKAPGFSPGVIGDGISAAIGNCANINNNSCQQHACTNYNYYDPADPDRWSVEPPGSGDPSPRVVFLFVVPYASYKNTGPQEGLPLLNFTAFYVTGWHGNPGNAGQNPCEGVDPDGPGPALPDEPAQPGEIVGYFVDYTLPFAPGDPTAACEIDELRPCVPVLVR